MPVFQRLRVSCYFVWDQISGHFKIRKTCFNSKMTLQKQFTIFFVWQHRPYTWCHCNRPKVDGKGLLMCMSQKMSKEEWQDHLILWLSIMRPWWAETELFYSLSLQFLCFIMFFPTKTLPIEDRCRRLTLCFKVYITVLGFPLSSHCTGLSHSEASDLQHVLYLL